MADTNTTTRKRLCWDCVRKVGPEATITPMDDLRGRCDECGQFDGNLNIVTGAK